MESKTWTWSETQAGLGLRTSSAVGGPATVSVKAPYGDSMEAPGGLVELQCDSLA